MAAADVPNGRGPPAAAAAAVRGRDALLLCAVHSRRREWLHTAVRSATRQSLTLLATSLVRLQGESVRSADADAEGI